MQSARFNKSAVLAGLKQSHPEQRGNRTERDIAPYEQHVQQQQCHHQ
jgi:hypothetical protein